MEYIKSKIRDVIDFPTKGIVFKDLTTAFKDPRALHIIGWDLSQLYRDKGITKVVGIESRGFIGGSILAFELGAGFVPCRKPGKLPADVIRMEYAKEYGTDTIEMHADAITPDDVVVIHDDVPWLRLTSWSRVCIPRKSTSTLSSSWRPWAVAPRSRPMPR